MDTCPPVRTADLLGKLSGSDNAWSVDFAVSEITDFATAWSAVLGEGCTVACFGLGVQQEALQASAPHPQQAYRDLQIPHQFCAVSHDGEQSARLTVISARSRGARS